MARDMELEVNYWVNVAPEDFEYGRDYRLLREPYHDKENYTPVYEIKNTGAAHSIQTDNVAKSNYRVIAADDSLRDKVAFGSSGHGYESVIVPADRPPAKEVVDVISALDSYPLLDDMDHSELEMETSQEDWESWGRREFVKETLTPAIMVYAKALGEELDEDTVEETLEDDNAVIDLIYWDHLQGGEHIESGDSTNFNFRQLQRKLKNMDDEEVMEALLPALALVGLAIPAHMKPPKF